MIIYNVTYKVDWSISEDWLRWMKSDYIPLVLDCHLFYHHQMVKLLQVEETDGPTYAVQLYTRSLGDYNQYLSEFAPGHLRLETDTWGSHFINFGTIMEVVK